jgi:hypothetical protein
LSNLASTNAKTMNQVADLFHKFGADHEAQLTKSIADRMSKQAEQITKGN